MGLDNSLNELTKLLNKDMCDLNYAYIDILAQFSEFIDSCNIDTNQINKSILDQIKEHYELSNASYGEEDSEGETDSDNNEDNYESKEDSASDNNEDNYESKEDSDNNEENSTSNNEENSTSNNTSNKINDSLYHKIIAPNFKHFNFDSINHPPKEEDYKTFERNN